MSSLEAEVVNIAKIDTFGHANFAVTVHIRPEDDDRVDLIGLKVTVPVFATSSKTAPDEARKVLLNMGRALTERFGVEGSLE